MMGKRIVPKAKHARHAKLCYYPRTLRIIRRRLLARYPDAVAEEGARDDVHHTLWMIEQVPTFPEQGKIDRWVGWIGAKAHSLGLLDAGRQKLTEARRLVKSDLEG